MKKQKIIAFEGIDGSGKTTLAKIVAHELGFQYLKTPSEQFSKTRKRFDQENVNFFVRFLFYASAVYDTVTSALNSFQVKGIVLDRYVLSLQVYHEVLTGKPLERFIKEIAFPETDWCFLLNVPVSIAQKRLRTRGNMGSQFIELNDSLLNEIQQRMLQRPDVIILDNSKPNIEKTVRQVLDMVQKN